MHADFDPYYIWLGIPLGEQPPNHYRLLGLGVFESHAEVIEMAADRQMRHVQTFKTGPHSAISQKLLNELSQARLCLLRPNTKADYDRELRTQLDAKAPPPAAPAVEAAKPTPAIRKPAAEPPLETAPAANRSRDDFALKPVEMTRTNRSGMARPSEAEPRRSTSKTQRVQVPWAFIVGAATVGCCGIAAVVLLWPERPITVFEVQGRPPSAGRIVGARRPGPAPPAAPFNARTPPPSMYRGGEPPSPPGAELRSQEIDVHLAGRTSENFSDRHRAVGALQAALPTEARRPEVARALERAASHPDLPTRTGAIRALAVWGSNQSVPTLLACLESPDVFTRNEALGALAAIPDERAVNPLISRLADHSSRRIAVAAIRKIGSPCEPGLIKLLTESRDSFLRRDICNLLKEVGTQASVPTLTKASQERSPSLARAAKEALQSISQR